MEREREKMTSNRHALTGSCRFVQDDVQPSVQILHADCRRVLRSKLPNPGSSSSGCNDGWAVGMVSGHGRSAINQKCLVRMETKKKRERGKSGLWSLPRYHPDALVRSAHSECTLLRGHAGHEATLWNAPFSFNGLVFDIH
jgi:hypothetical protein